MIRPSSLLVVAIALGGLATACASWRALPFSLAEGDGGHEVCDQAAADDDGAAFVCDDAGGLVACAGGRALTKQGGLSVCTEVKNAAYMFVCEPVPASTAGAPKYTVELLPCPMCSGNGATGPEGLGVVDFDVDACALPPPLEGIDDDDDHDDDDGDDGDDDEDDGADLVSEAADGDLQDSDGAALAHVGDAVDQAFQSCPCPSTLRCDTELDVCVPREACDAATAAQCDDGDACVLDDDVPVCVPGTGSDG